MKFFYSSGAKGYAGEGYFWHRLFNFPDLPLVTKTITRYHKQGRPFAVLPWGKSVFNKIGLHNPGFAHWFLEHHSVDFDKITVSLSGTDEEINQMIYVLEGGSDLHSIELNYSCPNVADNGNSLIPDTTKDVYLKLNHTQNPFDYDLGRVKGIRVNSIPMKYGGGSGKIAQEKNWKFIDKYIKMGLNVAGCSFTSLDDIKRLEDMGCKEIGIGSIIITNPKLVEKLGSYE